MIKPMTVSFFFLIYLGNVMSLDENKSMTFSLWFSFESEQSSLHLLFHNPNTEDYSRLYLDLSANISSVEESISYNISTINITKAEQKSFNETGSLLYVDSLYLTEKTGVKLISFPFYLTQSNKPTVGKYPEGRLALSRSHDSVLYQLYSQGKITNRIISLSDWDLCLGSLLLQQNKNFHLNKAPLINHYNQWASMLHSVIFGKINLLSLNETNHIDITQYNTMNINLPFVIDSYNNKNIVFPYSYAKEFIDVYLKKQIDKEKCVMMETPNEIIFECNNNAFYDFSMYLIFEGVLVELTNKDLEIKSYKVKQKDCLFPIIFKPTTNVVILGRRFIKKFNLVLDDMDETIGFPSSIPSYSIDNTGKMIINTHDSSYYYRYAYYAIGSFLLLGISQGIYVRIKLKGKKC